MCTILAIWLWLDSVFGISVISNNVSACDHPKCNSYTIWFNLISDPRILFCRSLRVCCKFVVFFQCFCCICITIICRQNLIRMNWSMCCSTSMSETDWSVCILIRKMDDFLLVLWCDSVGVEYSSDCLWVHPRDWAQPTAMLIENAQKLTTTKEYRHDPAAKGSTTHLTALTSCFLSFSKSTAFKKNWKRLNTNHPLKMCFKLTQRKQSENI